MIGTITSWFNEEPQLINSTIDDQKTDLINKDYQTDEKHSQDIINNLSKSINLDEAKNVAKDIGTYFFSFGKFAADQVTKSAKQLKVSIEENTIIGEFSKEQEKFVNTNLEKKKLSEVAVPPWVGYNNEDELKAKILALSQDKRNVLRSPPSGVGFTFDYDSSFPVAMVMLQEDPQLNNLRFELVPKQIAEHQFWSNYFYRVSLIRQTTEISTITASLNTSINDDCKETDYSTRVEEGTGAAEGIVDAEFASDAYLTHSSPQDENLHQAIQQLKHKTIPNEESDEYISAWETELQAELQEYEVVGDEDDVIDADLEQEILKQLSEDI